MLKTNCKFLLSACLFGAFALCHLHAQDGDVTVNQDAQITTLLKLKKEVNKERLNYKIQVYSGNRSGAEKARVEFRNVYTDWSTSMEYETPNYKVWIGNFNTQLEADRALLKIKENYIHAFIFKPKKDNTK